MKEKLANTSKPLFSYLCPYEDCRERNYVFREDANLCFNCHREMWLGAEAREARWYEKHGRRLGGRKGRRYREKGEEMNRSAGRPKLARSVRRFGGLSGSEYWEKVGPDPADQPADLGSSENGVRGCITGVSVHVSFTVAVILAVP